MELSSTKLSDRVAFRFFAVFDIQLRADKTVGFGAEQLDMVQAILRSSAIKRRVAQMAIETDLSGITGCHLSNLFEGPSVEGILDVILNCLDTEAKPYWEALRREDGDALHHQIMPVFLAFDVTLHRAGLEELSETTTEPIRKVVGPTMDASSL